MFDALPYVAQVLYTLAVVPALVAVYRAKRSDQVSMATSALVLTAHSLNVVYSTANGNAYAVPFVIAAANVLAVALLVVYYRVFPGGR